MLLYDYIKKTLSYTAMRRIWQGGGGGGGAYGGDIDPTQSRKEKPSNQFYALTFKKKSPEMTFFVGKPSAKYNL